MADIKIRGIPDSVLEREKHLAKITGVSLNARLRALIENDVQKEQESIVSELQNLRTKTIVKHGVFPKGTGVKLIREDRDTFL